MNVIGERFGVFQLLRQIAKGASSRVFLASDGKVVKAVKLFPPEHRARAERELTFGQGLSHPHLNPVEAALEVAGYPGVVMPFVPGRRLGSVLAQGRELTSFLATFRGLLLALGYLHARGVVHQDVKPENVLIDKGGHARLIDFDLAVHVGTARRSGFAGTVAYLSPEQVTGEPVTPASDLYAAGIILYRALTGEVPFVGSIDEVMQAHRERDPLPPSHFDSALRPFDALVGKLLAKAPERRFAAAADLLEGLSGLGLAGPLGKAQNPIE